MKVAFLPQAANELADAADYYEDQRSGLGRRFRDELDAHLGWIAQNAEVPRLRRGSYRRVNMRVFPYYIAYVLRGDVLWVVAVAHGQRKPEYWIKREQDVR
jgi:toxin ParE1/3/4